MNILDKKKLHKMSGYTCVIINSDNMFLMIYLKIKSNRRGFDYLQNNKIFIPTISHVHPCQANNLYKLIIIYFDFARV